MVPPKTRSRQPFFSIVIPTLNEEKYLPNLLNDLTSQSYPEFEVVVVDAESTDQTKPYALSFSHKLDIRLLTSKEKQVALQRNIGMKHAKGKWLIFMDADNRLPTFFLDGLRYQIAQNDSMDCFTCLISPDSPATSAQLISKAMNSIILLYERTGTVFALGALLGVKRIVALQTSFDSNIQLGEDHAFIRGLVHMGFHFRVIKEPLFTYSLRRLRREGILRMTAIQANILINTLNKQSSFTSNYGYVMEGGGYYQPTHKTSRRTRIQTLSKQQWKRLKQFAQLTFRS